MRGCIRVTLAILNFFLTALMPGRRRLYNANLETLTQDLASAAAGGWSADGTTKQDVVDGRLVWTIWIRRTSIVGPAQAAPKET